MMEDEYWAQNEAELACLVAAGRDPRHSETRPRSLMFIIRRHIWWKPDASLAQISSYDVVLLLSPVLGSSDSTYKAVPAQSSVARAHIGRDGPSQHVQ